MGGGGAFPCGARGGGGGRQRDATGSFEGVGEGGEQSAKW